MEACIWVCEKCRTVWNASEDSRRCATCASEGQPYNRVHHSLRADYIAARTALHRAEGENLGLQRAVDLLERQLGHFAGEALFVTLEEAEAEIAGRSEGETDDG